MANDLRKEQHATADSFETHSPSADYGLNSDHGFDPTKYDFYNPSTQTAGKAFVVTLDQKQGISYGPSNGAGTIYSDLYEPDTPSPLSPIEELEDDDVFPPQKHRHSSYANPDSVEDVTITPVEDHEVPEKKETLHPLEQRSELLFSRQHLQLILADATLSLEFADFLRTYRPDSLPILAYYFDTIKALKTIKYAESIIKNLEPIPGHNFTAEANSATMGWVMEDKADRALDVLVKDDLPAFLAYVYVRTVDVALVDRVTGRENPQSRGIADGLAEVFVLSDPARPDNPIVFTSEEFHRMTQYPRNEFLGHNCRILGGSRTSAFGIGRFRTSLDLEREHCEILLNYRKDGSPFINLIMCVPLCDQSGKVRYYLGAQLDITDLVNDCTGLRSLERLVRRHDNHGKLIKSDDNPVETLQGDEFEQLSGVFNPQELEKLLQLRQRQLSETEETCLSNNKEKRYRDDATVRTASADLDTVFHFNTEGNAPRLGYYKTYLLVRPYPSLRILFASPDLRTSGLLQSPLMNRVGGSSRVRDDLAHALQVGRKVTAKIQWLSKTPPKSRPRWIHCTPLLGTNNAIGVWMVILVDDEDQGTNGTEHASATTQSPRKLKPSYTAEALPWDVEKQNAHKSGVSTKIWSDAEAPASTPAENIPIQSPSSILRGPSMPIDVLQSSMPIRPGPRIAGRVYSFTSSSDGHNATDDGSSINSSQPQGLAPDSKLDNSRLNRPSSSNSSMTPMQSTMRPKVRIDGENSIEGEKPRKPPVNLPYRPSTDGLEASNPGRPPVRRTYKSLSPYGILFQD